VTVLRFPAKIAVGELSWEDDRQPGGWGHQLPTGAVDVPDGTAVQLNAGRDPFDAGPAVDPEYIRGLPVTSRVLFGVQNGQSRCAGEIRRSRGPHGCIDGATRVATSRKRRVI
jgi:hypothetical protein